MENNNQPVLETKIEETKKVIIKKREKSLIDKELLASNEGFTDCEIFD